MAVDQGIPAPLKYGASLSPLPTILLKITKTAYVQAEPDAIFYVHNTIREFY